MVHLGDVSPAVWDDVVEDMEERLKEFDFQEADILLDWRKFANSRRFDRELFETYGHFKDIILHPKFQYLKQLMEDNIEYVNFDLVLGDPFMPAATALIVLFMLHKRVGNEVLALAAAFIFNLNPAYVVLAVLLLWIFQKSKKPKGHVSKKKRPAAEVVAVPIAISSKASPTIGTEYDHILVGSDLSTLYTAALLGKNGHRCCVLQPIDAPLLEANPIDAPCAVPLVNLSCGRIERYQYLLDVVQSHAPKERVVFSPLGTEEDGYTSAIIRTVLPSTKSSLFVNKKLPLTLSLRSGDKSLVYDLLAATPFDKTAFSLYLTKLRMGVQSIVQFLFKRSVPSSIADGVKPSDGLRIVQELSAASTESVAHSSGLESTTAIDLFSSLEVVMTNEGLTCDRTSALSLAQTIDFAASGVFYPDGGYPAVEATLCRAISTYGGVVYRDVDVRELILDEAPEDTPSKPTPPSGESGTPPAVKAGGVRVTLNSGSNGSIEELELTARHSVISGLGVICTNTKLIPNEVITDQTITTLALLREARPKVLVVFWLKGTASELGLTSTDYYETCPRRNKSAGDSLTTSSASDKDKESTGDEEASAFVHIWCPSVKDAAWSQAHDPSLHAVVVEMEVNEPTVSLKTCHFSSIDDQPSSITDVDSNSNSSSSSSSSSRISSSSSSSRSSVRSSVRSRLDGAGPSVYVSNHADDTCTNPEDSNYTSKLGHTITMSKSKRDKYESRAREKVKEIFPLTNGSETSAYVRSSFLGGHVVSNTIEKYTSTLSAFSDVRGLFYTGRDLSTATGLAGDLQAGFITANAVLDYSMTELAAGRNIVSDMQFVN